tara:strand:- start:330 stop:539 length:210 start_codon:yes stop_codon:yes gene_type:complete
MNILVTGANGQLGSEIKDLEANLTDFRFFFMDLPELDILNNGKRETLSRIKFNLRNFSKKNLNIILEDE